MSTHPTPAKKTALITGATGFIGQHLVRYLLDQNFMVRALVRNTESDFIKQYPQVEWKRGDLTQLHSLLNLCEGVDHVFHLAGFAHASGDGSAEFDSMHEQINFQGTINLLSEVVKAEAKVKVRSFVFLSSVKAGSDSSHCIDETSPESRESPSTVYGLAKRKAEQNVLKICEENNISGVVLRPALVYGVGMKGNLRMMLHSIEKKRFPPLPSYPNKRSLISAQDLCRAAVLASNAENLSQRIFIVTDGMIYSTAEIESLMRLALGQKKPTWHLPLWAFRVLALAGDLGEKVLRKPLPMSTKIFNKLFGNAWYQSKYIQAELKFVPEYSLGKILPEIIKEKV